MFIDIFLMLFDVPFPGIPIIISLSAAFLLSLLNFPLFKRLNIRPAVYFQVLVDITLITVLVYFSETFRSPFYFLYIAPIIISSLFLTRRDTIYVASFAFIAFGVLSVLVYLEVIPFYPQTADLEISLGNFIYNMTMSFIAFSLVAVLSSLYFDRMRKTSAELKHVQDSLRDMVLLNNTVMEKMENGFLIADSKGVIISYNERAKTMLGLDSKSNIFTLLFAHSGAGTPGQLPLPGDRTYFESNRRGLVLGVSISLVEDIYSFERLYVFIITDLSVQRAIEEKLRRKEHLALIGEMSAGIAHEIRNPLASISGSVQFLRKALKLDNDEYKNLMDIIVKESDRLSQSIEDFLDFTKTTPLEKIDMDLSLLVDEVVELLVVNQEGVIIVKKYGQGYVIHADMKKIKQLLWNLVTNAIKAVNGAGAIEINIFRKDGDVNLSVSDDGVGIDAAVMEKIFMPFYSKFTSGIGLGMALVKRIVDDHNFDIRIDSQKGIGSEVTVCFRTT
jgi:two-component system sensor histidine kinase PilS (NtrC family)